MKQHNSDIIGYVILGTFGLIILGALIYFIFVNFKSTQASAQGIVENTNSILADSEDAEIKMYDKEEIRGDNLRNFIKEQLGEFASTETAPIYIKVTTVASGVTYDNTYTNNVHISDISNFSSLQYFIKPTAYFDCNVVKSTNKAILGVTFVQK